MGKTHKWSQIKNATMSPEDQIEAHRAALQMLDSLPLAEIRRARELTQEQLADTLEIPQAGVSKLEHRVDMYVSTLRRYIEAMGGQLLVIARFPNAELLIEPFQTAGEIAPVETQAAARTGRAAYARR